MKAKIITSEMCVKAKNYYVQDVRKKQKRG